MKKKIIRALVEIDGKLFNIYCKEETEDIEEVRKEFKKMYQADKVLFEYEESEEGMDDLKTI